MTQRFLITCAPPNPNGDLHLGHLSGPFFGADVLRRYLRARGRQAVYVAYTDDHSIYVPRRANELGLTARETAARYTRRIEQTLALADMLPDHYSHPHRDSRHDRFVRNHFLELWKNGTIAEQELPTPYCPSCQVFRYEAYLRGRCRFCGVPSDGTYCEDCGLPQDPGGLHDARCVACGTAPEYRPSRRLVVPLSAFADRLTAVFVASPWRQRVLDYVTGLVEQGLPDVPISREADYGLPVPLADWSGHVLDTWFSGIFGYLAATAGYGAAIGEPGLWRELWQEPETVIVHFIGFDCSFSHAVLWPALLLALGEYQTPTHVISNEFYNLEGEKFSTSRGHAIWGSEFLREAAPDAVRLHLARTNPEYEKSDFRSAEFDRTVNDVLVGTLESWAAAVFDELAAQADSVIPAVESTQGSPTVRALAEDLPDRLAREFEPDTFSLRGAAGTLVEAVGAAAGEWGAAPSHAEPGELAAHLELLATLAAVAAPLMPGWSAHTARQLGLRVGLDGLAWPRPGLPVLVPGQRVAPRFQRLFQARQ
ncbi:methionine--tRNA ligase [Amycolatopsis pithecellobii]|nr:class I tRNA ligase family protein [Amycolatopsis pithecellobii]